MRTVPEPIKRLFEWKVRGVRCVEIIGVACVLALVFSVYIAKAAAARESAEISSLERDIRENRERVRLLRAEVTRLEQPARLEALSREIGLGPVDVRRQAVETGLPAIAPPPAVVAAPAPVAAAPVAQAAEPVVGESLH